jgi:hypothetical protein
MTVVAAGYEGEARAFDRAMIETRARWRQVEADESGKLAKQWLSGASKGTLTAAIRESLPTDDPERARALYRSLSGDVHPDLPQFMANLVRETKSGGREMGFSPHRTPLAGRSLLLYAWLPAEAVAEVGARVSVDVPDLEELTLALYAAGDQLQRDFTPPP